MNEVNEGAHRYNNVKCVCVCVRVKGIDCTTEKKQRVNHTVTCRGGAEGGAKLRLGTSSIKRVRFLPAPQPLRTNPIYLLLLSSHSLISLYSKKTWADRRCIWTNCPTSSRSVTCCFARPWQSVLAPSSLW